MSNWSPAKLVTKERLIFLAAILILGGWQGLIGYLNLGGVSKAEAAASNTTNINAEPTAEALASRVAALEISRAGSQVGFDDLKAEVQKMDAKMDKVLILLGRGEGRGR